MQNRTVRRRSGNQGKYIIVLVLVCLVLVFAIGLISKSRSSDTPDESLNAQETTQAPTSAPVQTEPQPIATQPIETTPVPIATAATDPTDAPAASTEYGHLYIRINREKTVTLPGGFGTDVRYSVNDDNVAVVDENGVVTGLQKGECVLTAESGTQSVQIPVTVREMVVEDGCTYVDGILVANKSYSLPPEYDPGLLPVTEEAFDQLSADAAAQGLDIHNSSDYRTYSFQVEVYNSMVDAYGKEYADSVSARPGFSEHQTGYTIDCNTIDNTFADTAAGKWLAEHCWEYGFIIRYPEDKVDLTGYDYESWHIRYVGVEHAKEIWEQGICLEEYLDIESKYAE